MELLKVKKEDGIQIEISVIGFFKIPDIEKEFVIYSLTDDDPNNENGAVFFGEVIRDGDNIQVLGILKEDKKLVEAYYNEIATQLGVDDDER